MVSDAKRTEPRWIARLSPNYFKFCNRPGMETPDVAKRRMAAELGYPLEWLTFGPDGDVFVFEPKKQE